MGFWSTVRTTQQLSLHQQTRGSNQKDLPDGAKVVDFVSGEEKSGNPSKTCSGEVSNWFGGLAEQSDQQGVRVDDPSRDFSDGIEVLVPPVGGWVCKPLQCSSEEILVISGGSKFSGSGLLADWTLEKPWIYPPMCLLGRILKKVWLEEVEAIVITLMWVGATWWPTIRILSTTTPKLIIHQRN